jgi:MHS family proline/betaine transporter-like MFS transporter
MVGGTQRLGGGAGAMIALVAVLVLPVLWTLPETVPGRAKR